LNVASLLLTRALSREREVAVRIAMGASPRQLVTQLMAESLVLSVAGAVVGIVAAIVALPVIVQLTPVEIPRLGEATVNWRALGLGLGVVAATTVFFGLIPALLLLRGQLTTELKTGERGSSRGPRRAYSILVAAEVALACALLVSSALLVRTVQQMMHTPTGVDADPVAITTLQVATPRLTYADWQSIGETHAQILDAIAAQAGVTAVGASNFLPFEVGWRNPFTIEGEPPPTRHEDAPQAQLHSVSAGYFEAMGATMSDGRAFGKFDTPTSAPVVVINDAFARKHFPAGRPVGRWLVSRAGGIGPLGRSLPHIRAGDAIRFEIVGVVNDVRNAPIGQQTEPAIYFNTRQFPFREQFIAVRAESTGTATMAIRNALKSVAPTIPMAPVQTWGERVAARTAEPRLLMTILLFFAALAALLSALGVYGLFSWSVALRTRELAIRLTLGARPASVRNMVVRQSVLLVIVGLTAGVVVVRFAASALQRVLYEVTPGDVSSTAIAMAVLLAAAIVACVPPALRAMRVDPVEGLRAE
jgi:putative ABC transport system permease protein